MSYTKITNRIEPWVCDVLAKYPAAQGERWEYEIGFQLVTGPNGAEPKILVYLNTPGAVIGSVHATCLISDAGRVDEEGVKQSVRQAVDQLLAQRTQSASQIASNPVVGGGLILPNGHHR